MDKISEPAATPPDAAAEVQTIEAEIARLRADLADLGTLAARVSATRVEVLAAAARQAADAGLMAGETALDDLAVELEGIEARIAQAMRRRPFQALGLAAFAGFILALFLRR